MQFDFQAFEALTAAGAVMGDARILELQAKLSERTAKLDLLIDNGAMMTAERDRTKLLRHIILTCQRLLNCDGGTLYLVTPDGTEEKLTQLGEHAQPVEVERRHNEKALRFAMRTRNDDLPSTTIPLYDPATGEPNEHHVSTWVALHNRTVRIDDVYADNRFDLSGTRRFDAQSRYRTVSMLTVPMAPRGGEVIGVLQFINAMDTATGCIVPFAEDTARLVEALAAQAAVALDNLNLVQAQKALIESMIRVLATAIDAKSHYTGRHCERVPELAMMLAEAACDSQDGPLAAFGFRNEDEWQEFRIGAWLHDCGKVTTPEYVIDKATKLETIYNRIHEVRMRFEVLLRDAEIERLQARLAGVDEACADAAFEQRRAALTADFAFVADCNVGGETMDAAHNARLAHIAEQRWTRHFDDRLGLSAEEAVRAAVEPIVPRPATEPLLADRPRHVIPRPASQQLQPGFRFKMEVPEHLYNQGELHNLGVQRGTLTAEERYKINEHMVHTVMMLERMPFPEALRRVPEYAGTHHETLNGTGYPRRLTREQLSVPSRIMAIADVFEALTAADRPYKTPKKLSEALRILHSMKMRDHIDPDLFDLFLTSGVYLRYAEKHLSGEQRDEVDIAAMLGPVAPVASSSATSSATSAGAAGAVGG